MKKLKILLVDDDETSLLILQNALESEGHTVILTSESLKATELFSQHLPDVVILDIFMPEKDGLEVLKEIRSLSLTTLIIVISSSDRYLRTAKIFGANHTLLKNAIPDGILHLLSTLPKR